MNTANINRILIPYDCIFNDDIGLYRVIREHYSNDSVFNLSLLDEENLNSLVHDNIYNNPLELIIREEYKDKMNDFYKEFLEQEYERILDYSPYTPIFEFAHLNIVSKMGFITFLVFNDLQEAELRKRFDEKIDIIKLDNYNELNIDEYDIIFLKRYENSLLIQNLQGKYIYLLDYRFNFEKESLTDELVPLIKVSLVIGGSNLLAITSI